MNIKEYQEKSKRTLNNDLDINEQIANMIFGITGESGEVADELKKHLYQGHELRLDRIKEEIGDIMFYIVNLCNVLDIQLSKVLKQNYEKLLKRYPNGFSEEDSINRRV